MEEIKRYCTQDVALLRDLLEHAEQHGHLCFQTKRGDRVRLPAPWKVDELVEHAQSRSSQAADSPKTRRAPRRRRLRLVEPAATGRHST